MQSSSSLWVYREQFFLIRYRRDSGTFDKVVDLLSVPIRSRILSIGRTLIRVEDEHEHGASICFGNMILLLVVDFHLVAHSCAVSQLFHFIVHFTEELEYRLGIARTLFHLAVDGKSPFLAAG